MFYHLSGQAIKKQKAVICLHNQKKDSITDVDSDITQSSSKPDESADVDSDVLGSYTGKPDDGGKPVQDADDL